MSRTLSLLIAGAVIVAAMTSARAQQPSRGKHNGKIVFISDRHYKGLNVWSMNPDGSRPTRLTDDTSRGKKLPDFSPVYDSHPVWSPDGKKIAFISNRDYHFSLYVMNADGSNTHLVTDKVLEPRSEEHTSELQSPCNLVCRLLLEKKKKNKRTNY